MSVHPVFGIAQNLQDFCFSRALWRGVHVLPPAGRGETHSDCPAGNDLSHTRLRLNLSCLFSGCTATYTVGTLRSGDRYKWLSSVKTNNTGINRRNVSSIFFPTSGKAERTKKKERAVSPTPQCMQVYLQRSSSSLLWHTSIMRKTSKKRNPDNFDSVDTRPSFSRSWTGSPTSPCWILVLKTKVMRDHYLLKRQLKGSWQRKKSVSSHKQMSTTFFLFFFFPPRKDPFMLWSELFILMKTSKTRSSQQSKDRTMLHHQVTDTSSVGSGMKLYGENMSAFMVKG